jgi:ATP-dependent DNA helicase RecQ
VHALVLQIDAGLIRILYVAPERLASQWLLEKLKRRTPVMLALDEAHCISEWGHNFRPDYLKIARFTKKLGISRVLALTATATPQVANEIRTHFGIAPADVVRLSFHRSNLHLHVTPTTPSQRTELLVDRLNRIQGPAVVYVTRQETAEAVATHLAKLGFSARAYHAGLRQDTRDDAQQSFMLGSTRIIVATIAFGMGIDKADIRAVFHYNLPKSLENYSQETGRAGRDDLPAHCEMFCCSDDLTVLQNFIHSDVPDASCLASLLDRILRQGPTFDLSIYDLSTSCDIRQSVVSTVLAYLELDGWISPAGPPFHNQCRLRFPNGIDSATAGSSTHEAAFIRKLASAGSSGRTWISLDLASLIQSGFASRDRILRTLRDLADSGDAVVEFSGVRIPFRLRSADPPVQEITTALARRFHDREQADLKRLHDVLALATHPGCLTDAVTSYFGESLPAPCGHCARCLGEPPKPVLPQQPRQPSPSEWEAIRQLRRENHPALRNPRQLARFLSGMSSPAATLARLYRHDAYGMWADLSFESILDLLGHPSFG